MDNNNPKNIGAWYNGWSFAIGLIVALLAAAVVVGCGGGNPLKGPTGPAGQVGAPGHSALVLATPVAPGSACVNGGQRIDSGLDLNSDGVLQASEITNSQYVCNGSQGAVGLNVLVQVVPEAAGSNCASGGSKVMAGQDANADGLLQASEISSTNYVCNGSNGADGTNGTNGTNGLDGSNGINGTTSLFVITAEAPGANCTWGGNKLTGGLDSNGNGMLDDSEISSTSYTCNGQPGSDLNWVTVSDNSSATQALSNTGYVANTSNGPVTLTLPPTASLTMGDLVRISGAGTGGWAIAPNLGQTIKIGGLPRISTKPAGWTNPYTLTSTASPSWTMLAASIDGSHLAAAEDPQNYDPMKGGGYIWTSADFGVTWTQRTGAGQDLWQSIASSADGSRLAAAAWNGHIWTSADYGATWTAGGSPALAWNTVASSADGLTLVAGDQKYGYDLLWKSVDAGKTWNSMPDPGTGYWKAVSVSSDASHIAAIDQFNGRIFVSADTGITWDQRFVSVPGVNTSPSWSAVAFSGDGTRLAVALLSGGVYTSSDQGQTWSKAVGAPNLSWTSLAWSANGKFLTAVASGPNPVRYVFKSTDYGTNLLPDPYSPQSFWASVTLSDYGSRVAALTTVGQIWTYYDPALQTIMGEAYSLNGAQYDALALQYVGNGTFIVLSWTSNSGNFVLQ